MRPGLPGHQPTGRAPKEGSACSLTHGSAHSSLSPPGRARAQLQGMGLPDAWPGRWRSQVGMRPVARRCASRARLGPALRQHPAASQVPGGRDSGQALHCALLGLQARTSDRGAREAQGQGGRWPCPGSLCPWLLPSGLDGREGVLSGPSRLAVGTEGQGSKMPLPPRGTLLGMPHTCSPFGPEEPCGPGRPRSPFSPCSPGGPMSPIRPG